jgi:putative oxidoreductase
MPAASAKFPDLAVFLLRFVPMALLVVLHGWDKLMAAVGYVFQGKEWGMVGFVAGMGFPLAPVFAVCAALAESLAAALLALGLFTRYTAAVVAFNMAVAMYHHLRTDMKFELAALYFLVAAVFVLTPAGRFSLDSALSSRR